MHPITTRALTAAALTLTLASGIAACGDDSGHGGMGHSGTSSKEQAAGTTATTAKDVDAAFVRQMIPHHEMAVAMAKSAQDRAERQEIKDLADAIVEAQEKEITQLRAIAKRLDIDTDSANQMMGEDAGRMGMDMDDMGMSMSTDDLNGSSDFDRSFIAMMVPHHEGAIEMAEVELAKGSDAELEELAKAIISAQETEIAGMKTWYAKWYGEPLETSGSGMGGMDHGEGMDHSDHMQ